MHHNSSAAAAAATTTTSTPTGMGPGKEPQFSRGIHTKNAHPSQRGDHHQEIDTHACQAPPSPQLSTETPSQQRILVEFMESPSEVDSFHRQRQGHHNNRRSDEQLPAAATTVTYSNQMLSRSLSRSSFSHHQNIVKSADDGAENSKEGKMEMESHYCGSQSMPTTFEDVLCKQKIRAKKLSRSSFSQRLRKKLADSRSDEQSAAAAAAAASSDQMLTRSLSRSSFSQHQNIVKSADGAENFKEGEMESESHYCRSQSMPTTFEDVLCKQQILAKQLSRSSFSQRLRKKLADSRRDEQSAVAAAAAASSDRMLARSLSSFSQQSMMEIAEVTSGDTPPSMKGDNIEAKVTAANDCDGNIYPKSGNELMAPAEALEGNSKIFLDDVFLDLQRFKDENGELAVPSSHPLISRFIGRLLSNEMEPFEQNSGRGSSQQADSQRQGMQRGGTGNRDNETMTGVILSIEADNDEQTQQHGTNTKESEPQLHSSSSSVIHSPRLSIKNSWRRFYMGQRFRPRRVLETMRGSIPNIFRGGDASAEVLISANTGDEPVVETSEGNMVNIPSSNPGSIEPAGLADGLCIIPVSIPRPSSPGLSPAVLGSLLLSNEDNGYHRGRRTSTNSDCSEGYLEFLEWLHAPSEQSGERTDKADRIHEPAEQYGWDSQQADPHMPRMRNGEDESHVSIQTVGGRTMPVVSRPDDIRWESQQARSQRQEVQPGDNRCHRSSQSDELMDNNGNEGHPPLQMQLSGHDHSIIERVVYTSNSSIPLDGPPLPKNMLLSKHDDARKIDARRPRGNANASEEEMTMLTRGESQDVTEEIAERLLRKGREVDFFLNSSKMNLESEHESKPAIIASFDQKLASFPWKSSEGGSGSATSSTNDDKPEHSDTTAWLEQMMAGSIPGSSSSSQRLERKAPEVRHGSVSLTSDTEPHGRSDEMNGDKIEATFAATYDCDGNTYPKCGNGQIALAESLEGNSKIGLDDFFLDLQKFKEENGDLALPFSHPLISRLIRRLSSNEMEVFQQNDGRGNFRQSDSQRRELQHDGTGNRDNDTMTPGISSIDADNDEEVQHNDTNTEESEPQLCSPSSNVIHPPRLSIQNSWRRLYRGQSFRARRAREIMQGSMPNIFGGSDATAEVLISATLVEEVEEGEVIIAEPVSFVERKWKLLSIPVCLLLALLVVLLSLNLTGVISPPAEEVFRETSEPTLSPTFDPRPTLDIVQERMLVRCGMFNATISSKSGFNFDLCRSVAAVLVGNPDSYEGVPITPANRWLHVYDRKVDLLVSGDTHTIEREIRESSTGAGFTFSRPYNYDGMVYFGNEAFVRCAEEQRRHNECSDLLICVIARSTHYDFITTAFPSDYYKVVPTQEEILEMLFIDNCNVGAHDKSFLQNTELFANGIGDVKFVLGNKMMTKEPLAIVTRDTDREFSDIINWVLQALIFGEEQGLTKNLSLCHNYTNSTDLDVSDLDFMNAVHCVGNYGELLINADNRGMNQINDGATGMLYAVPFGDLDRPGIKGPGDSMLTKIRNEGVLNCGVIAPDNFEANATRSDGSMGMGINYCRALAAALFIGDSENVNFTIFPEMGSSSFFALANESIDVLVGARVQRKYDFESPPTLEGFHFSTPYYYGNESANDAVSFYSLVTREDDAAFASFVNCIILATVYAQENGIQKGGSGDMPLVSVFGSDLKWALRDVIAYSGSYDEIYSNNFGTAAGKRGRNALNDGGPLMLSFPHLP